MKKGLRGKNFIRDYIIYDNTTPKMWAIIVMPIEIRIDNAHGYVHIHFSLKGRKHKINKTNFHEIYGIIEKHIEKNELINKKKLWKELL
ncbi:MAG: hypothetical protein FWH29_10255 [Methanobrevibacter sp.]|nr:hypothetical protein [Methanobrevibacter sp.]